jgi:molybdopterin/thiamine biosynthesis adenylyltransferase
MENYSVSIFNLQLPDDQFNYDLCIQSSPAVKIVDQIYTQLTDLIKIKNPGRILTENEIATCITDHLAGIDINIYGVWVFYPWRNMMVHLLGEDEFVEVKTNRNRNKITEMEQKCIGDKKIGIIGLSVGQSVAATLAMERSFGEIRLADFDDLDLSNCNRIRTGVFNLTLPKVVITAREILEMDPFLKVKCYADGITEQNIDSFITDGGKLDIIIEECDSLDVKILSRLMAKQHKIPLVMEMSDRGMIDIERYDLEPELKMFLGAIEHLDYSLERLKNLTTSEKINYLYPMVGGDFISSRLKESVPEVGKTLLTWPQLASAVVLGGGICADVVRRILLNQFKKSGRYYVDLEDLIQ